MLHEILLALSGHPSPLFGDEVQDREDVQAMPLSPSEKALLRSIGQLSELHRQLRRHIDDIAAHHRSIICRAAATSIEQTHLPRFQDRVIQVERKILTKDASIVGAYGIVPLAGIVSEFDDWQRRVAWYWDMSCFMKSPAGSKRPVECTGAALIDRFRLEQQTGFPDVEAVAIELSEVVETAWLRQIASWILYGRLPTSGADDFFIQVKDGDDTDEPTLFKEKHLLPNFVAPSTASSVLFIGKSLRQVRKYGKRGVPSTGETASESELAVRHLHHLSSLTLPIVPAQLSRAVSAIRLSLSQNVLQHLLPMGMLLQLLSCLKDFFLLGNGEFAITLINEAESRLQTRQQTMGRLLRQDPVKALQGLSIKEAEFHLTLSATFKVLSALDDDLEDDGVEFARNHVSLSSPGDQTSRPSTADSGGAVDLALSTVAFNDLLFPSATRLDLNITPPLDLFISRREAETYALINAYLLAIRRAHIRLSGLWRRNGARREQAPQSPAKAVTSYSEIRARMAERSIAMRKVWATCSAAIFLVSETSAYLEGEVIRASWAHFEKWVRTPISKEEAEGIATRSGASSSEDAVQRDPETLASGHRAFLVALTYDLLLNDMVYTRELRSLIGNIDKLIAFLSQLLDVQQKLDLERDAGGATGYTIEEERRMALELDRARKKIDSDLKSVVNRLRQLDLERIGAARYLDVASLESGFEPFKSGGIERLLMKLEFGSVVEPGPDMFSV